MHGYSHLLKEVEKNVAKLTKVDKSLTVCFPITLKENNRIRFVAGSCGFDDEWGVGCCGIHVFEIHQFKKDGCAAFSTRHSHDAGDGWVSFEVTADSLAFLVSGISQNEKLLDDFQVITVSVLLFLFSLIDIAAAECGRGCAAADADGVVLVSPKKREKYSTFLNH